MTGTTSGTGTVGDGTRSAADLTATELLAAYRARELSPVDVTRAVLDRVAERDAEVSAFCLVIMYGCMNGSG